MATQLFLIDGTVSEAGSGGVTSGMTTGIANTSITGAEYAWRTQPCRTTRGDGGVTASMATPTVAGTTNGVDVLHATATGLEWITLPLAADVTISGTVTANIWASESSMSANVAINVLIERLDPTGAIVSTILKTTRTTELATTNAANNFTGTPTSTNMTKGDRIRIRVFGDDAGTMASGHTFTIGYNGATAAANGDTYVTFAEDFSFIGTNPTGTTLHLTDVTGPDIFTGGSSAIELEMWTAFGGGSQTINNTPEIGGFQPPFPLMHTGSIPAVWVSRKLSPFTLSGPVLVNLWAHETGASNNVAIRAELLTCNQDGSGESVWAACTLIDIDSFSMSGGGAGAASRGSGTAYNGELTTSAAQVRGYLLAPDRVITARQRLVLRIYQDNISDDGYGLNPDMTFTYDHTTTGTGDCFITLGQTVTEYVGGPPWARRPSRNKLRWR